MNNDQIDNTSYYALPDGRQLEDFIAERRLTFAEGNALKYLWRAGKKDGESADKDYAKARHYIAFQARAEGVDTLSVQNRVEALLKEARGEKPRRKTVARWVAFVRAGSWYVSSVLWESAEKPSSAHHADKVIPVRVEIPIPDGVDADEVKGGGAE